MSRVQVVDVEVLDNPSEFSQPFKFQITFDCMDDLPDDLEWKIIYVGSAESERHDQILDSVLVGPIPAGRHKFVFEADPPNPALIPVEDVVGVTVVIITCTYHGNEFVRVGYYVNNEYLDAEMRESPPEVPQFDKLRRNILSSAPRVTRFKINWDGTEVLNQPNICENLPPASEVNSDPVFLHEMSFDSTRSGNSKDTKPSAMDLLDQDTVSRPKRYEEFPNTIERSIDAFDGSLMLKD